MITVHYNLFLRKIKSFNHFITRFFLDREWPKWYDHKLLNYMSVNQSLETMKQDPSKPPMFKPLIQKRAFEEVSAQIKELIYSEALKPGDKLPPERELARQFNIGRMAIREALRILEDSGFIYLKTGSGGGAIVKDADSSVVKRSLLDFIKLGNVSLEKITEARIAIEQITLEFAMERISDDEIKHLEETIKINEEMLKSDENPMQSSSDFHILLARCAKNQLFEAIVESLISLFISLLGDQPPDTKRFTRHINDHKAILQAIKKNDLKSARKRLKDHILYTYNKILRDGFRDRVPG